MFWKFTDKGIQLKEEYKDEFYDKIISEFVTGISIVQIEY